MPLADDINAGKSAIITRAIGLLDWASGILDWIVGQKWTQGGTADAKIH